MSNIIIPDVSAEAEKSLGRTAQVNALAPFPAREPVDRYNPLREPWAHEFIPGLDHRLGKLSPPDAALLNALARIDPANREQARTAVCAIAPAGNYPALCGPAGARLAANPALARASSPSAAVASTQPGTGRARYPQAAPGKLPSKLNPADYTILDTGGVLSLIIQGRFMAAANIPAAMRTASTPGPAFVTGISYHLDVNVAFTTDMRISIDEIGFQHAVHMSDTNMVEDYQSNSMVLGVLAVDGATLTLAHTSGTTSGGGVAYNHTVKLAYRDVQMHLKRPPLALATPSPEGVSTYVQLDPTVAAIFDAAGIPPAWYELPA